MPEKMRGVEQAAILLLGIGEENAAEILKHMDPEEVQKLGMVMSSMKGVNREEVQVVVQNFVTDLEQQTGIGFGTDNYVQNMLENALGKDKASGLYNRIQLGINTTGLESLRWMEGAKICDLIRQEHPQIKSLVLSYLDEEKAAEVLALFSEAECVDLLKRIATLEAVQPEIIAHLNEVMEGHLAKKKTSQNAAILGGVKNVSNILNYFDSTREEAVLSGILEVDEVLGREVKDLMFIFDHLIYADDRSMQMLLRNVASDVLILALRGASEEIKEKVFTNMSKRAAELMRDDMDSMGPVRLSDVDSAQKEVVAVAARMRESGDFNLIRGGEEMV